MLCSKIIRFAQQEENTTVLYYFCNYVLADSTDSNCGIILRSLAAQVLRNNPDLAPLIFDDYISQGLMPSISQMRQIIPTLLSTFQSVRIIIDGLDEYDDKDQKLILTEITSLAVTKSLKHSTAISKVLISSRDVNQISRILSRRPTVSLSDEQAAIGGAIQAFVRSKFSQLVSSNLDDISLEEDILKLIEQALVEKADGGFKFLWAIG